MEFSAYSEYKHSGVEWLGEVPRHWDVVRFGKIFDENKRKNLGMKETNVLSLSYGNIKEKNIDDNKGLLPESFETYQIIEPNDIIFRFTDLQNDKRSLRNAISKFHGIITSAYISVKTQQNSDFYNYLFRAYDLKKVFYSMGDGMRQSLKMDELNRMPVVLPSINEQNQIARFLDKETAKIDELIAKQEQLITLLEEQRKSVISYAVTKGLNPNAPMKDSGVEWLGEVPEHWNIRKVFSLCEQIGSGTTPSATNNNYYENGTINFLQTGDLTDGYVNLTKKKITEKALNEFSALKIYPKDSLVIAMYGATIGKIGILNIETTVNQACCVLNLSSQIDLNFAYYLFLSAKSFLISLSQGGTQPNINQDSIKSLRVTLPSKSEQRQIVEFLKKETLLIHNLIQKQQELITQLKEYRSSVISHAVTGKIDVRGLV